VKILYKKRKGFSLAFTMILLLTVSLGIAAQMHLVSLKRDTVTNTSHYARTCIASEGAAVLTSTACEGTIKGCTAGIEKDCNSLFAYVDDYHDAVFKVAKEICEDGGEKGCLFLMDKCVESSADCDLSDVDNDVNYYLNLDYTVLNSGRSYIQTKGTQYYNQNLSNFNTFVDNVCDAEWDATKTKNTTACKIIGAELGTYVYDFDEADRSLFNEEDSTDGTTFTDGIVELIAPEPAGGGGITSGFNYTWAKKFVGATGKVIKIHPNKNELFVGGTTGSGIDQDIFLCRIEGTSQDLLWQIKAGTSGEDNIYEINYEFYDRDDYEYKHVIWSYDNSGNQRTTYSYMADNNPPSQFDPIIFPHETKWTFDNNLVFNNSHIKGDDFNLSIGGNNGTDSYAMLANTSLDIDFPMPASHFSDSGGSLIINDNVFIDDFDMIALGQYKGSQLFVTLHDTLYIGAPHRIVWQQAYKDSGGAEVNAIMGIRDSNNNVILTGYKGSDLVVAKIDQSDGSIVWQTGRSNMVGTDIALDSSDNVYVAGHINNGSDNDVGVVKLNSSGTLQWQQYFDSGGEDVVRDIDVYDGNIYLTGDYNGDMFVISMSTTQASSNMSEIFSSPELVAGDALNISLTSVNGEQIKWTTTNYLGSGMAHTSLTYDDLASGGGVTEKTSYVTTSQYNRVSGLSAVTSVSITYTDPSDDTDIKWIISSDEGATWKAWNGSSWTTVASGITDYDLTGYDFSTACSTQDVIDYLDDYDFGTDTHLDFAFQLSSSSETDIPSVSDITVTYY